MAQFTFKSTRQELMSDAAKQIFDSYIKSIPESATNVFDRFEYPYVSLDLIMTTDELSTLQMRQLSELLAIIYSGEDKTKDELRQWSKNEALKQTKKFKYHSHPVVASFRAYIFEPPFGEKPMSQFHTFEYLAVTNYLDSIGNPKYFILE